MVPGLKFVPGLHAGHEIHLGTQPVLECLLSPVQKIVQEAKR